MQMREFDLVIKKFMLHTSGCWGLLGDVGAGKGIFIVNTKTTYHFGVSWIESVC